MAPYKVRKGSWPPAGWVVDLLSYDRDFLSNRAWRRGPIMGTATVKTMAGNIDVCGIAHFTNVVGIVTGMPADGLRLLDRARSLWLRLTRVFEAGHPAGSRYCPQPVLARAMRSPEPMGSGADHSRLAKRLGRPGSATRVGRW